MTTPRLTLTGPGGRPTITGRVDQQRVAAPWIWNGLCFAATSLDGVMRDWVSGAPPSPVFVPAPGRDPRGGEVATFDGVAVAYQEFADNSNQQKSSNALTVLCRFSPNGTSPASAGVCAKVISTAAPYNTWLIQTISSVNSSAYMAVITVGGTNIATAQTISLPVNAYANFWLRWQAGGTVTLTTLTDAGAAVVPAVASSTSAGPLQYTAGQPIRLGGGETTSRGSPGGSTSHLMVWSRQLSDPEMYAVTVDPDGFLRRGAA